ncbi:MAG: transposase, partial [Xenococcaceae cyanobacterium]
MVISEGDQEWSQYLEAKGITSQQGIKLVTEAALLGSAIEHGLSPEMIILSDGAKQFAILVHALCWVHMERSLRRLNGVTAQQRQEIEQVQDTLWTYYRELKTYQEQPTPQDRERLEVRFDEIFGLRYPHHYGLNLV